MSEIVVAIISSGIGLIGTIITVIVGMSKNSKNIEKSMAVHQAVTETKLDELSREVRRHNNFAERMPVVEEQIKVINHRISDLEKEERRGA